MLATNAPLRPQVRFRANSSRPSNDVLDHITVRLWPFAARRHPTLAGCFPERSGRPAEEPDTQPNDRLRLIAPGQRRLWRRISSVCCWPAATRRHPAPNDRSRQMAAGQARKWTPPAERPLAADRSRASTAIEKSRQRPCWRAIHCWRPIVSSRRRASLGNCEVVTKGNRLLPAVTRSQCCSALPAGITAKIRRRCRVLRWRRSSGAPEFGYVLATHGPESTQPDHVAGLSA